MFRIKKKKIDWFLLIFLIFALIIFSLLAFFINKKLVNLDESKKNLAVYENFSSSSEKIISDYENYLNILSGDLASLSSFEDKNQKNILLQKIEEDLFSVKVPIDKKDFHLHLALLFMKIKSELGNLENNDMLSSTLVDLKSFLELNLSK